MPTAPDPTQFILDQSQNISQSDFFHSAGFLNFVSDMRAIFLLVSLVFFIHIIVILFKHSRLDGGIDAYRDAVLGVGPSPHRGEFSTRWYTVETRIGKMQEAEYKLAIIEADKILDDLLQRMLIRGDNMQAKLKQVTPELMPSIDRVWKAHKIRNKIVHDADFHLSYEDAREVVSSYRAALRELNILD